MRARDRGDAAAMRLAWEELVIDFADRMDGLVAATHKGRLDDEEHELAVQLALAKFASNLLDHVRAARRSASSSTPRRRWPTACASTSSARPCAAAATRARRWTAAWDADRDDGRPPAWDAEEAGRRHARDEERAEAREFLEWALPQLSEDRRRVLELTLQGAEVAEIMRELDISRDNAYQLRSRGLKDLGRLKEQFDA